MCRYRRMDPCDPARAIARRARSWPDRPAPGTRRRLRVPRGGRCRACAHYAARHGALSVNPVRDTRPIACPRKPVRALSVEEATDLLRRLRGDPTAVRLDLPDFVEVILGTGVRIGEASAVRQAVLDLDAGSNPEPTVT